MEGKHDPIRMVIGTNASFNRKAVTRETEGRRKEQIPRWDKLPLVTEPARIKRANGGADITANRFLIGSGRKTKAGSRKQAATLQQGTDDKKTAPW